MNKKTLLSLFALCILFTGTTKAEASPIKEKNQIHPTKHIERINTHKPEPIHKINKPKTIAQHRMRHAKRRIHPNERSYRNNRVCINLPGLYISF